MRIASMILPSKDNNGVDLTDVHCALRTVLCDTFGGFTAIESQGGWNSDAGLLYLESGVTYMLSMDDSEESRAKLESIALFYGHMAAQLCVMVVHANGAVKFVDCAVTQPVSHAAIAAFASV
jgi:hypothetical protein